MGRSAGGQRRPTTTMVTVVTTTQASTGTSTEVFVPEENSDIWYEGLEQYLLAFGGTAVAIVAIKANDGLVNWMVGILFYFNLLKLTFFIFYFSVMFIADNLFWTMLSFGMWNAAWKKGEKSSPSSPRSLVWKARVRWFWALLILILFTVFLARTLLDFCWKFY